VSEADSFRVTLRRGRIFLGMRIAWFTILAMASATAAGCGEVVPHTDAAPPVPDASTVGPITVDTYSRPPGTPGQRVSGIDIIAIDPDGTVNTAVTVGGTATLVIEAGASVTAVYRNDRGAVLFSFLAAAPGDHLVFGEQFAADGPVTGTMTASFPSVASSYQVHHACGAARADQPATTVRIDRLDACARNPQDLLYLGLDAAGGLTVWGFGNDVPFTNGGSTSLPNWQGPGAFTIMFTGVPAGVSVAAQIQSVVNGVPGYFAFDPEGAVNNGAYSLTRPWPPAGDAVVGAARFDAPQGSQFRTEALPVSTTSWSVNNPVALPWLTTVAFDPGARRVTWSQQGSQPYDAVLAMTQYTRREPAGEFRWFVIAPAGGDGSSSIELPELPAAFGAYAPLASDTAAGDVMLWDYSQAAGYDQTRQLEEWVLTDFVGNLLVHGTQVSVPALRVNAAPVGRLIP
jgi:hypothetical protein